MTNTSRCMALARYSTGLLCWITLSLQAFAGNSPAAGENRLAPLGAGDSVSIQVYEQPNMNSTVYVGNDGAVNLPLAGAVHVAGLTPIEAAQRVQDALKSGKFLKDPHVTITVVQSSGQRVSVLGEVHQPGRYPIDPSTTVLDLLAEAGGLTDQSADVIYINRPDQDGKIVRHPFRIRGPVDPENGLASRTVQSGDSVVVPVAEQFYIYGEVAKPNKYRLQPDTTVIQAISLAGGLTPRGSDRRVQIKRMGKDGRYVIVHGGPSDFVLPDDVIRVRQSIF